MCKSGKEADEWAVEIILKPNGDPDDRISFIQNLYDKTTEKINHFDKLRQQHINFALVSFAGLLGFVMSTQYERMQYIGCAGIAILMLVFLSIDYRLHKYTHGFSTAMLKLVEAQAELLNNADKEVKFYQYYKKSEIKARTWRCLHYWLYGSLMIASVLLGLIIFTGKLR